MPTPPEISKVLSNEGTEAETMTPQQFGDLMRSETERSIKVAHEANISIDQPKAMNAFGTMERLARTLRGFSATTRGYGAGTNRGRSSMKRGCSIAEQCD